MALALGALSIVSIVWPQITGQKRPPVVQKTYDTVKNTQFGQSVSAVLGISSDMPPEQIQIDTLVKNVLTQAAVGVESSAKSIIARQTLRQLLNQYNALDEGQRSKLHELICNPPATP
ncbi:hypothetical protein A2154_03480 [Candidatus Gottesmanbacteria bacterium RBG_16_43_7]|uniref:Uncharacterized protein n=1 Tax=Candidatus Gottesmanbacteria bacterium RBG_16_43_7 TaxID=1798373 RepID=A0A1F5Z7G7_9BACT|nr:MAG: hypothetical protein A2154_03480 [Candidatus Gottesmanbacteria bacterium RBG_16_43_7]